MFNINYRVACTENIYLCGYSFAVPPTDVRTAMHWVRTNAHNYASFTGKVAAVGTSAGGNLVYLVGDTGIAGDTKPNVMAGISPPAELGYTNCTVQCTPDTVACHQAYVQADGDGDNVCTDDTELYMNGALGGSQTPWADSWAAGSPACPPNINGSNPPPPTFIANASKELVAVNEAFDFQAALNSHNQLVNQFCEVSAQADQHKHGTQLLAPDVMCDSGNSVYDNMVAFLKANL